MPYILDKTNIFLLQKIFFYATRIAIKYLYVLLFKNFFVYEQKEKQGFEQHACCSPQKKSSAKTANAAKTNALPKPVSPFIVLRCLADIYGVDKNTLSFAVAEIPDGEDGFDLLPIVLIANSGEYIDLVHGIKVSMSHSAARAGRHNFLPR